MRSFLDTKKEALELEARRKIYDVVKRYKNWLNPPIEQKPKQPESITPILEEPAHKKPLVYESNKMENIEYIILQNQKFKDLKVKFILLFQMME